MLNKVSRVKIRCIDYRNCFFKNERDIFLYYEMNLSGWHQIKSGPLVILLMVLTFEALKSNSVLYFNMLQSTYYNLKNKAVLFQGSLCISKSVLIKQLSNIFFLGVMAQVHIYKQINFTTSSLHVDFHFSIKIYGILKLQLIVKRIQITKVTSYYIYLILSLKYIVTHINIPGRIHIREIEN